MIILVAGICTFGFFKFQEMNHLYLGINPQKLPIIVTDDENEFESYMNKINRKGLFLKSMLDDFFQYFKLASRDIEINKENICLQELIRQLVEEEELVFEDNGFKLS